MKRRRPRNAPPALPLPANTIAPTISGTAQVPNVLTCDGGSWTGSPTLSYQWKRNGANIALATASTYALAVADVGANITCAVSATNTTGASLDNPKLSNAIGPIAAQPALNALTLSASSIVENTVADTVIGTIGGTTAGSSLSLVDNAGGRFAISGNNLVAGATPTDYEAAVSHDIIIQETLAGATNSPRQTTKTITVVNALEAATLVDLNITGNTLAENSVEDTLIGTITGKKTGSNLTLTNTGGGKAKLVGSSLFAGATATDYETATEFTIELTEELVDSPNSPHITTLTIFVTNVAEGGGGPSAPVLTLTSIPGDNPPNWSADYVGIILGRSTIRLNWRVNAGAWQSEDHLITSDDLATGAWDWPAFEAAAPFAQGAVIDIREFHVLDAGAGETVSPASNTISDTIEDITPNAFSFTDVTGAAASTLIESSEVVVGGIAAPAPISVSSGEYRIKPSGGAYGAYTAAAGYVSNGDTVQLRKTSSNFGSTAVSMDCTIGGVTDNWSITTAGTTAGFVASVNQPAAGGSAGSHTFPSQDFEDGIAVVFITSQGVQLPLAVTLDGVAMTYRGQSGTTGGTADLILCYTAPVTAGTHSVFVDRASTGGCSIMTGTLKNANPVPVDTAVKVKGTTTSPHDATSQLDINVGGIGLVHATRAGNTFGAWRGGVTQVAVSPDGLRYLGVMSVSGTPGFTTASSVNTGILSLAFDKAP